MPKELNLIPSPQISVQVSGVVEVPPVQAQPDSSTHPLLHPSFETALPSSQYVAKELNLLPSPQISEQVSAEVVDPPEQTKPTSFAHVALHPSPEAMFPSSQ